MGAARGWTAVMVSKARRRLRGHRRRAMVDRLLARDGDECFFCLAPLGDDITLEHIKPWAIGGSNRPKNLALAHGDCNWATKDLTVDQKMLERGDALMAALAEIGAAA